MLRPAPCHWFRGNVAPQQSASRGRTREPTATDARADSNGRDNAQPLYKFFVVLLVVLAEVHVQAVDELRGACRRICEVARGARVRTGSVDLCRGGARGALWSHRCVGRARSEMQCGRAMRRPNERTSSSGHAVKQIACVNGDAGFVGRGGVKLTVLVLPRYGGDRNIPGAALEILYARD